MHPQPGQRVVIIEVVRLDVGDDEPLQMQVQECTEGFVGLENKQIGLATVGVGVQVAQMASHHERRIAPQCPQAGNQKRGRRGLSMGPGDAERRLHRGHLGEQAGPLPYRDAGLAGSHDLGI